MAESIQQITEEAIARVVKLANSVYGHGWMAEVDRRLGHSRGVLKKSLDRRTLRLRDFLQILDVLELEAGDFFKQQAEDKSSESSQEEVIRRLEQLAEGEQPAPDQDLDRIKSLKPRAGAENPDFESGIAAAISKMRRQDPSAALEMARSAINLLARDAVSPRETLPLLLEFSSSCLSLDKIDMASAAFLQTFRYTSTIQCVKGEAEVLLRLPRLAVRKKGDYRLALWFSERALMVFSDLMDSIGQGKASVLRGRYHFLLDDPLNACRALQVAQSLLGDNEPEYIFTADLLMARYWKSRNPENAASQLSNSKEFINNSTDPQVIASYNWILGEVELARGKYLEGETALQIAREIFMTTSPVKASLVSIELANHLIRQGRTEDAGTTTKDLVSLLAGLDRFPIVEAAVAELIRLAYIGRLTSRALVSIAREIRKVISPQLQRDQGYLI